MVHRASSVASTSSKAFDVLAARPTRDVRAIAKLRQRMRSDCKLRLLAFTKRGFCSIAQNNAQALPVCMSNSFVVSCFHAKSSTQ